MALPTSKTSDVRKFLLQTGFIFELELAKQLRSMGYSVEMGQLFLDLTSSKKREIDIIARKNIGKIKVNLIIECKQSLQDSWIFIGKPGENTRFYQQIKHQPKATNFRKSHLFDSLHCLDFSIPQVHSHITMNKKTLKKSTSEQIDKCLEKLPKAVFDVASGYSEEKNLYFPIAAFSGQIFVAEYEDSLEITEQSHILYPITFGSKYYKTTGCDRFMGTAGKLDESLYSFDDTAVSSYQLTRIVNAAEKLMGKFQIDFVTKAGFKAYLKQLEDCVSKVSSRKWAYNLVKPPVKRTPSKTTLSAGIPF